MTNTNANINAIDLYTQFYSRAVADMRDAMISLEKMDRFETQHNEQLTKVCHENWIRKHGQYDEVVYIYVSIFGDDAMEQFKENTKDDAQALFEQWKAEHPA